MKAYWGSGGTAPHILDLSTRWRWVVSFTPRPLTHKERAPGTDWIGSWVGPRAGVDTAVKLSLCFNWAPRHEGVLVEWRYSSTYSLTSALDVGEWSASRRGCFTPRERAPGTHCIRGWVGPRAVLDAVVKRKISSPRRESNHRTPIVQSVAQRYTDGAKVCFQIMFTGLKTLCAFHYITLCRLTDDNDNTSEVHDVKKWGAPSQLVAVPPNTPILPCSSFGDMKS
jgi:hypothetical protein